MRSQPGSDAGATELGGAHTPAPRAAHDDEHGPAPQHRTTSPRFPIAGTVRRSDGSPLTAATVTLTDLAGRQIDRCVTDQEGRYRIRAGSPGDYLMIGACEGHPPRAERISLRGERRGPDLVLTGLGGVTGTVRVAHSHRPVPGLTVVAVDPGGDVVTVQRTGSDGTFRMSRLIPGGYTLTATGNGWQPAAASVSVVTGQTTVRHLDIVERGLLGGRARIMLPAGHERRVDLILHPAAADGDDATHPIRP